MAQLGAALDGVVRVLGPNGRLREEVRLRSTRDKTTCVEGRISRYGLPARSLRPFSVDASDATGALVRITNHLGQIHERHYDLLGRPVEVHDANQGTRTFVYDLAGALVRQQDARGQVLTWTYDLQGRVLRKQYPDTRQILWTYDDPAVPNGRGRVTRVADLEGTITFSYDLLGRVTQSSRVIDQTTYTLGQAYDAAGRVVNRTFPDGDTIASVFNEAGWLSAVPGIITSIAYNARGQRTEVRYANGVTARWVYDPNTFRVGTQSTTGPSGALQNLTYAFDATGNLTRITDTVGTASRSFQYDALKRLKSASGPFATNTVGTTVETTQAYRYDAVGNIIEKSGLRYLYSDAQHPSAVTGTSDNRTYIYDANGSAVFAAGRELVWDTDARLQQITTPSGNTVSYGYDWNGRQVRKISGSGIARTPFAGYEIAADGTIRKDIVGVSKYSSGKWLFQHSDLRDGLHVVTDASGTKVQLLEYTPWGTLSRLEGYATADRTFAAQDSAAASPTFYDTALGRFLSADPRSRDTADPQTLNPYVYLGNNPVTPLDSSFRSYVSGFPKGL